MERFKLNIDIEDASFAGRVLTLAMKLISQNPTQKTGNSGAIRIEGSGKKYMLIRNIASHTIREV